MKRTFVISRFVQNINKLGDRAAYIELFLPIRLFKYFE